ncbi:DUF5706 domain-containing protein [Streptomyces phaeofaciens JCM 4814]|uniref:Pycsar effector protein domain-containing protein n=1 Tax=Streptomyces phaeofaciens TaxID=68254 RepID=A0A918HK42_9ACTN|nr:Pycsar system effector family protein [Streptomyces phaeofaciens]GGT64933.1 hypothetical protein GCM10010226_48490 [Streptomyces phaeofaciens]
MSTPNTTLTTAHAEVKAEITRTDTKAGLLLAFVGAVLAGVWSGARDLPMNIGAYVVGGLGLMLLVAAIGLLLRSTRPNLRGRHGFPLWATLTPDEITATVNGGDVAADVAGLSRIAVAKFTCLRRAVDLTMVGGVLLLLAVLIAAGGAL